MPGFADSDRNSPNGANRVNILGVRKVDKAKTHFKVQNIYRICQTPIGELKSDGRITIKFPIAGRTESEKAIEVHCDDWES